MTIIGGRRGLAIAAALWLGACGGASDGHVPGDSTDTQPYAGIAEGEVLHVTGTEPFWGGTVEGNTFTYSTPENIDGVAVPVERFAGRGGVSFSGELDGAPLDLAITPGDCSDGMSSRTYPFAATLQIGGQQRSGCAYREGDELDPPA